MVELHWALFISLWLYLALIRNIDFLKVSCIVIDGFSFFN